MDNTIQAFIDDECSLADVAAWTHNELNRIKKLVSRGSVSFSTKQKIELLENQIECIDNLIVTDYMAQNDYFMQDEDQDYIKLESKIDIETAHLKVSDHLVDEIKKIEKKTASFSR